MPGAAVSGSRIRVRLATVDDAAACAAIYTPYVTDTAVSFELSPPDADEMRGRITRTIERTPWVVVELDGVVRGYAYGTRHQDRAAYDWTMETTVYVDRAYTRRGIGRVAMEALLAILRLQGAHLVVAGVTPPNPGSVGLHEALGFARIGRFEAIGWKQGRWHGVEWFGLELGPRGSHPAPLVPLPRLAGSAALTAVLDAQAREA
jgi:L-amino acid N-acyltransferase YncA